MRRSSRRSLAAEAEAETQADQIANGAVAKKSRNNNPDASDDNGSALDRFRRAAELGKLQLGFHNDQYIEDISVESVNRCALRLCRRRRIYASGPRRCERCA